MVALLIAGATALLAAILGTPILIRTFQARGVGQQIRDDGPQGHFSKAGTPTKGGALILLALVTSTVLWADPQNPMVWLVTAVTALYGGIGYIDDARKIRRRDTGGLSARYKLLLQFALAFLVCGYLWYGEQGLPYDWIRIRDRVNVPFVAFDGSAMTLPTWLYVVLASIWVVGISNAVNLTDGLDGLAIGPVMINAGTYGILAYVAGLVIFGNDLASYLHIPSINSVGELAVYCGAVIGAGVGFLWYNTYPAQVFMGDVGSLALGGGLGMLAIVTKNELLSIALGGIFIVEAVSVITQVTSFKLTGKRVFLMAPIHHHYEKKGWPEPRIIVRFWIIAIMLAIASLATLKLR